MAYKFSGGIHPNDQKSTTNQKPIEKIKAPEVVHIPMSMHIGTACVPIVKIGSTVKLGQKIADSDAYVSAPIHASVSGTIMDIGKRIHPNGQEITTISIKNDYKDTISEDVTPYDLNQMTSSDIIDAIRKAGIVGHGGATFPTHVKIESGIDKVDTIIINGAECEPYITSDHRLLLECPEKLIGGLKILEKVFGITNVKIGIEKNKSNCFEVLEHQIEKQNSKAEIVPLKTRFPQGAEKQLIFAITKRKVPSGKLPSDVSCAVFNVDTVIAIHTLFETGMPMVRRIVTVSGSAIANPKNLHVPIGTIVKHLVENAGGLREQPNKLIMGGPMMGHAQFTLDVPVIRGTNAFLAFCENEDRRVQSPACIRCGKCVGVCPMNLVPIYLNAYSQTGKYEEFVKAGGLDCMECGSCAYVCPARVQLVQSFKTAKHYALARK